eukprot:TRINITY_DN22383_c0_g1_i1.p1 TRINITY_DN22383_c0_g1~~TRINITY_DN22383_c0_g1_i1.p1  ORF type:complete len:638 (-),score=118.38 TRINITY_DN22383_c0_g1_i1:80-1813(-)
MQFANSVNLSGSAAFFVNDYEDSRLFSMLDAQDALPKLQFWSIAALRVFALEKHLAGVTFHYHESAWQVLLTGSKEWFLMPPSVAQVPLHSPCNFVNEGIPPLAQTCTLNAGDLMLVPEGWWHATCSRQLEGSVAIGSVGFVHDWPQNVFLARQGSVPQVVPKDQIDTDKIPQAEREHSIFSGGEGMLFVAASFGHTVLVKKLLALGASPNLARADGRTALHEAARRGDLDSLKALVAAKGDVSARDKSGSQLIHHACAERAHRSTVDFLLSRGASASSQRFDGQQPLHIACRSHTDPVPVLRALLESGHVQPSPRDESDTTPLMYCAARGHARGVGLLLHFLQQEDVLHKDASGKDAMGHALAGRGDLGVTQRLLKAGLSFEHLLPAAAELGDPYLLTYLVEHGARLDRAMLASARAGHAANIKTLLQLGAEAVEFDAESAATPLHLAAFNGHTSAMRALLTAGADAMIRDADNLTAMHYAAGTGHRVSHERQKQIFTALADAGSQSLKPEALQPLHIAAANGDTELVRWLVFNQSADLTAIDAQGTTPAEAAAQGNHAALAELMKSWAGRASDEL